MLHSERKCCHHEMGAQSNRIMAFPSRMLQNPFRIGSRRLDCSLSKEVLLSWAGCPELSNISSSFENALETLQDFFLEDRSEFLQDSFPEAWPQPVHFSEFAQYILGGWADYPWDQRPELSNNGIPFKESLRVSSGLLPGGWMLHSEGNAAIK